MSKKTLLISVLSIIVVALLLMMERKKAPPKTLTAEDVMPDFQFELIHGGYIKSDDMDSQKFTLLNSEFLTSAEIKLSPI